MNQEIRWLLAAVVALAIAGTQGLEAAIGLADIELRSAARAVQTSAHPKAHTGAVPSREDYLDTLLQRNLFGHPRIGPCGLQLQNEIWVTAILPLSPELEPLAAQIVEEVAGVRYLVPRTLVEALFAEPPTLDIPERERPRRRVDGVYISGVRRGSLPDRLGLSTGDILLAANGHPLRSARSCADPFGWVHHANEVCIDLLRQSKPRRVCYVLTSGNRGAMVPSGLRGRVGFGGRLPR